MKIDREFKIEAATLQGDTTRENLSLCYLRGKVGLGKNGRELATLAATDGHMAAVVPVEMDPGDSPGFVLPEALTAARKLARKGSPAMVALDKAQIVPGGATYPRPKEGTAYPDLPKFPDLDSIIPHFSKGTSLEMARVYAGAECDLARRAAKRDESRKTMIGADRATMERGTKRISEEARRDEKITAFLDRRCVVTFGVNIDLLTRAAKAIGTTAVRITVPRAMFDRQVPFEVRSRKFKQDGAAFAVVMPINLKP